MVASRVEQIYQQHIKPLPVTDRLRLAEMIARDAAEAQSPAAAQPRSILELEGLGAEIWQGVDPQQYVDDLRKEWDRRP